MRLAVFTFGGLHSTPEEALSNPRETGTPETHFQVPLVTSPISPIDTTSGVELESRGTGQGHHGRTHLKHSLLRTQLLASVQKARSDARDREASRSGWKPGQ